MTKTEILRIFKSYGTMVQSTDTFYIDVDDCNCGEDETSVRVNVNIYKNDEWVDCVEVENFIYTDDDTDAQKLAQKAFLKYKKMFNC